MQAMKCLYLGFIAFRLTRSTQMYMKWLSQIWMENLIQAIESSNMECVVGKETAWWMFTQVLQRQNKAASS